MKKIFIFAIMIVVLLNGSLSYAEENYGLDELKIYKINIGMPTQNIYPKLKVDNPTDVGVALLSSDLTESFPEYYRSPYISTVKDQRDSSNCWIFSSMGAVEGYMLKNYPVYDDNGELNTDAYDFSENHMQYMVSNVYNNSKFGHNMPLGSGGNSGKAIPYFLNRRGLVDEFYDQFIWPAVRRDYSETANIPLSDYIVTGTVFNHENLPDYDGRDLNKKAQLTKTIKKLITEHGSVVSSVNASDYYFADDKSLNLYYFPVSETSNVVAPNHSVLLVGWDDNYDKENFRYTVDNKEIVPPDNGAFIVKNSWGTDTGEEGFFYLSYYDYYVGYELFAVTEMQERKNNEVVYSYDDFYPYNAIGFNLQDELGNIFAANALMFGNQFEKKTDDEILTDVSFYAVAGSVYDIYLINDELKDYDGNETENFVYFPEMSTKTTKIYNEFVPEYDGYYTVDVADTKITSEKFSVMIIGGDLNGGYQYIHVESSVPALQVTNATQEKLQSFYYFYYKDYPDYMYDYYGNIKYLDENGKVQEIYGNAPVKAITKTTGKYSDISFINYTDENKNEKTTFTEGENIRIAAVVDGANLENSTLVCGIYKGDKLIKVLSKPIGNKGNIFFYENIPADFNEYTVRVFALNAFDNIKPLGNVLSKALD